MWERIKINHSARAHCNEATCQPAARRCVFKCFLDNNKGPSMETMSKLKFYFPVILCIDFQDPCVCSVLYIQV